MVQFGDEFGTAIVSNRSGHQPKIGATHLEATRAWMHVLSSMTPTCVFSSSATTGTLTAFGRRVRHRSLWSSDV